MEAESRLADHLRGEGYKKLYLDAGALSVWFLREQGFVTAVALYSIDKEPVSEQAYREQIRKIGWRFRDAGCEEPHLMTILITERIEEAAELSKDDYFSWIADAGSGRLVIPSGHAENFYGIRDGIAAALAAPAYESRYLEAPLQYEPGGKLCYTHIGQRPVVNHALLILNLCGYLLCIMFSTALYEWGDLRYRLVFESREWYRIFSSMFLHADAAHLTGNMLMLLLIGDIAERAMGHIRYLILYLAGGILAGGCSMYISYLRSDPIGSIGASGAVFAVVGALVWVILRNGGKLESLSTKKILFLIAYSLYFGFTSTGVDNAAHVGGLIGGFLLAILFYRKKRRKE